MDMSRELEPHTPTQEDLAEMHLVIQDASQDIQSAVLSIDTFIIEVIAATMYRVDVPADIWENTKPPTRTRYRKMALKVAAVVEVSRGA